jgi:hypothetical protein
MKALANDNGRAVNMPPRDAARQLDREIAALREELSALVAELDRRRHEALDVKLQVKRHGLELALTGVALIAAASGFVWFKRQRSRRRAGWRGQLERLRDAVRPSRKTADRAQGPRAVTSILTAAANAGVAAVIKKGLERALRGPLSRRRATTQGPRRFRALTRWPREPHRAAFDSEPVAPHVDDMQENREILGRSMR